MKRGGSCTCKADLQAGTRLGRTAGQRSQGHTCPGTESNWSVVKPRYAGSRLNARSAARCSGIRSGDAGRLVSGVAVDRAAGRANRYATRGRKLCGKEKLVKGTRLDSIGLRNVRGGGRGYQNGGPLFANLAPRLSLFSDPIRTYLAIKGSLRRAQLRRALDRSGPFRTTLLRRGKGSLRTAPLAGDHFAAILVPFFAATDSATSNRQNSASG